MALLRRDACAALSDLADETSLQARYARVALHEAVSASTVEIERASLERAERHLVKAILASGESNARLESAFKLTWKAIRDARD